MWVLDGWVMNGSETATCEYGAATVQYFAAATSDQMDYFQGIKY